VYIFLTAVSAGLTGAAAMALASVGFSLQFGIGNLFNLAFGALMTLGAFFAYEVNAAGLGIWQSGAIAGVGLGLFSILLGRGIYRPFTKRARRFGKGVAAAVIMVSFGVAVIVQYGVQAIWGASTTYSYSVGVSPPAVSAGGFVLTWQAIASLVVSAVLCTMLGVLLRFTQFGRAMRATSGNERLARSSGVPIERILDASWLISGAFCGVAGVLLVLDIGTLNSFTGSDQLLLVIAGAIVGGIGSPLGAVIGAVLISVVSEIAAGYVSPDLKYVIAFALLLLTLLFRPSGIVGSTARAKAVVK
jgi:branched-subunit amino acid ABC-type transport system permease component